jgi:DNA-directed RNA polymerase specialized sigma24 family protein
MSPLTLRRYRAELLLKREFSMRRGHVAEHVELRLRAVGVELDRADVEACYAMAWQGLYGEVLAGAEIESPVAWLVTATHRRCLDEHRACLRREARERAGGEQGALAEAEDVDALIDERDRLRHLLQALRGRLTRREREAALLCYLHGLSRPQAAARMGVSDAAMRRLMDGAHGRRGVARKVGRLLETVREGSWCEEQGSLMRGFAFGVLAPGGERHSLALAHCRDCPACRAYVISLRGLAIGLPPVLAPWSGTAALLRLAAPGSGAGSAGGQLGGSIALGGSGALSGGALGAAGAPAGGWLAALAPVGAKLALGCVLAAGVGYTCATLETTAMGDRERGAHRRADAARRATAAAPTPAPAVGSSAASRAPASVPALESPAARATAVAQREFGVEPLGGASAADARREARPRAGTARARADQSSGDGGAAAARRTRSASDRSVSETAADGEDEAAPGAGAGAVSAGQAAAVREFAPG